MSSGAQGREECLLAASAWGTRTARASGRPGFASVSVSLSKLGIGNNFCSDLLFPP